MDTALFLWSGDITRVNLCSACERAKSYFESASICTRVCLPKADLNSRLEYAHASARRETSMSKHAGLFCDMSAQPVETHHSKMRLSHCNQNDSIRLWVIDCAPVTAVQSAGSNSRITRDRCGRYFCATVTWGAPDADSRLISAHVNARRLNGAMKAGERCPSRGVPAASITVGSSSSGAAENVFAPGAFRAKTKSAHLDHDRDFALRLLARRQREAPAEACYRGGFTRFWTAALGGKPPAWILSQIRPSSAAFVEVTLTDTALRQRADPSESAPSVL